jgi:hypothetical protein
MVPFSVVSEWPIRSSLEGRDASRLLAVELKQPCEGVLTGVVRRLLGGLSAGERYPAGLGNGGGEKMVPVSAGVVSQEISCFWVVEREALAPLTPISV